MARLSTPKFSSAPAGSLRSLGSKDSFQSSAYSRSNLKEKQFSNDTPTINLWVHARQVRIPFLRRTKSNTFGHSGPPLGRALRSGDTPAPRTPAKRTRARAIQPPTANNTQGRHPAPRRMATPHPTAARPLPTLAEIGASWRLTMCV